MGVGVEVVVVVVVVSKFSTEVLRIFSPPWPKRTASFRQRIDR